MQYIPSEPVPAISAETESRLKRYCALLCAMNERVRLVGPRDELTLWKEHITDCLHLLPFLPPSSSEQNGKIWRVIDVGTGGGLPGAVLAICRPDIQFTLLDSLSRKTNALNDIISELQLNNVTVICARSEEFAAQNRESFDCATVRAVSEAGIIAEYLSPLVAVGGRLIAMKAAAAQDELSSVTGQWQALGLAEPVLYTYPMADHERCAVLWRKTSSCPPTYPRRPGRAEKKPWWQQRLLQ